jgi:hypothetical protein
MLLVILLILLLPAPAAGPVPAPKPLPPPRPTPTPTPTDTTAPADGTGNGGTPQPTFTGGGNGGGQSHIATPTPSSSPTATEKPTGTVYFNRSSYSVEGSSDFWTAVMLDEMDYFWGAQFDIDYDYNYIRCNRLAATNGSIYDLNNASWVAPDGWSLNLVGSGPNGQGLARVLVYWDAYPPSHGGDGINTSGGTLINLRWRAQLNTGVTDLNFTDKASMGFLILVKFKDGLDSEIQGVTWTNSSVTVK